jgi:hypothetical protein
MIIRDTGLNDPLATARVEPPCGYCWFSFQTALDLAIDL